MSQPDAPVSQETLNQASISQAKPQHIQPSDAPGDVPDIAAEYGIIGVDKEFWENPFIEVEKDKSTGKKKKVI